MKSQRKICAADKSYVKVFEQSGVSLTTGCTRHPGNEKYCPEHINLNHPSVIGSKMAVENRRILRSEKTKSTHYTDQDFTDRYSFFTLLFCYNFMI